MKGDYAKLHKESLVGKMMEFSTGFADDNGFDSHDPEEAGGLLRNTFHRSYTPYMQQYLRPVAGILLVTLAIACISHLSSAVGVYGAKSDIGLLKYQSMKKGRQPVKEVTNSYIYTCMYA